MSVKSMRRLVLMLALMVLSACAPVRPGTAEIGPPPSGYQQAVREYARSAFFDPYSVRDAEISEPLPASMVFDGITPIPHSGWMVCLRANAKNRFGAYTGRRLTGYLFANGVIETTLGEQAELQTAQHCQGAKYAPFSM
jgi:hypothetical protein